MDELIAAILQVAETNKIIIQRYETGINNMSKEMAQLQSSTDMILSLLQGQPETSTGDFLLEQEKALVTELVQAVINAGNNAQLGKACKDSGFFPKKDRPLSLLIAEETNHEKIRAFLIALKKIG